jgi:hypothetical protein
MTKWNPPKTLPRDREILIKTLFGTKLAIWNSASHNWCIAELQGEPCGNNELVDYYFQNELVEDKELELQGWMEMPR